MANLNEGISVKWKAEKYENRHIRMQNMRELINVGLPLLLLPLLSSDW